MRKNRQIYAILIITLTIINTLILSAFTKAPKPQLLFNTSIFRGQSTLIAVTTPNYTGSVQYRLELKQPNSAQALDLTHGYTPAVSASKTYQTTLPMLFTPGAYRLNLYVKKAGSTASYDQYTTKAFTITNDISLTTKSTTYDLYPYLDTLKGNLLLTADQNIISNINLSGTFSITEDQVKTASLKNVTTDKLIVNAKSLEKLYLYNSAIKALTLTQASPRKLTIYLLGKSSLTSTQINTPSEFKLSDKATIQSFSDPKRLSNLSLDAAGMPMATVAASKPTVNPTTAGATTPAAVTPAAITPSAVSEKPALAKAPFVNLLPPQNIKLSPYLKLPALPLGTAGDPAVEYAAVLIDRTKTPITLQEYQGTYGIDFSTEPENTHIKRVCISVSKDATINFSGISFSLKAHQLREIKVLEDFGIVDTPPEGMNMINSRATFGNQIRLVGELNATGSKPVKAGVLIKLN